MRNWKICKYNIIYTCHFLKCIGFGAFKKDCLLVLFTLFCMSLVKRWLDLIFDGLLVHQIYQSHNRIIGKQMICLIWRYVNVIIASKSKNLGQEWRGWSKEQFIYWVSRINYQQCFYRLKHKYDKCLIHNSTSTCKNALSASNCF